MNPSISRFTHMDDWIFEVKMVRALRVRRYGDPYTAVATLTANGEQMYVDSQLARDKESLSQKDFSTFYKFCQQLDMKSMSYDSFDNGERQSQFVDIVGNQIPTTPVMRLVR